MELDEILNRLQRLAEPNGLITSDIEWAETQLTEWRDREVAAELLWLAKEENLIDVVEPGKDELFHAVSLVTLNNRYKALKPSKETAE